MPSKTETILAALGAALEAAAPAGALVGRNIALPVRVPPAGMMILRDGDPGEPATILSPLMYVFEHRAVVEIAVQGPDGPGRDARFDALRSALGAVLADRTLGGLCDWIEVDGPGAPDEVETDGADPIKAAEIGLLLNYVTDDNPLT